MEFNHLLFYEDTKPWIDNPELSAYSCPQCHNHGQFRRGAEFAGEMICMKCHEVWSPGIIEIDRRLQAKFLCGQFGDGI